ncbi:hypothetical protein [Dyella choica]|uniref:CD-NTase-associated protein 12/Pycsar effector protein TIR domain-containing protein n=1 Tax=Dyella choica TaxID=1927959 RepID=A0A3S0SCR1_9GAMM|nr:hypothetical protein [Dyella choica]RUL79927.1 hypothetical protein EKH80_01680 [Dyella choica]
MAYRIFFSWQSDTPNAIGRSFIQACIEQAIKAIKADASIDLADRDITVDRDTRGVPGSPPIMETIFRKIDEAAVFVADFSYVAHRIDGSRTPNPNVCIEHGYALKSLGWRRVLAVMNTCMGDPGQHELPFDIRHTRRPMLFSCADGANRETREEAKDALTRQLITALKAVFDDETARTEMGDKSGEEFRIRQAAAEAAINELSFDAGRGGVPKIVTRPRLILRLVPFAATLNQRLSPQLVSDVLDRFSSHFDAPVEGDCDAKQWWRCARPHQRRPAQNPETSWLVRIARPGYFEFQINIGQRIDDDRDILVDGLSLESTVVGMLENLATCAVELGLGGAALVSVTLDGVEDVRLMRGHSAIKKRISEPYVVPPAARLVDLSNPMASLLHEQLDIFWQASGWSDGSPSFENGSWAGYLNRHSED